MTPTPGLLLAVSILLAVSDTGFNIIGNASLGILFQADSEIGFMMLNAMMSLGSAVVFFAGSFISLYPYLVVEVVLCTVATIVVVLDLPRVEIHSTQ